MPPAESQWSPPFTKATNRSRPLQSGHTTSLPKVRLSYSFHGKYRLRTAAHPIGFHLAVRILQSNPLAEVPSDPLWDRGIRYGTGRSHKRFFPESRRPSRRIATFSPFRFQSGADCGETRMPKLSRIGQLTYLSQKRVRVQDP